MSTNTELPLAKPPIEETESNDSLLDSIPSREIMLSLPPNRLRAIYMFITGTYSIKKIASVVGVHEMTVRKWFYDPTIQQIIKELQERESFLIEQQLKVMRNRALETMDSLLDSPLDPVRFSASKDILDRTGHKAIQEMKIDKKVTTFETQIKNLANTTISDAEIIDVVAEEIEDEFTRRYRPDTE